MAQVMIYGPNLHRGPADAPETFHAHAPTCAHQRLRIYRTASEPPWTIEAESERDVWMDVYPPDSFDYDPDDDDDTATYREDVKIFPCISLPKG